MEMNDPESLLTSPAFLEILRALGLTNLDADVFQMLEDARQQVSIGEMSMDEYEALKASVEFQLKQAAIELANLKSPRAPQSPNISSSNNPGVTAAAAAFGSSAVRTLNSYVHGLTKAATAPAGEKPILESELYKAPLSSHFANVGPKTFKKRYFVLYRNCLCYYGSKGDLAPKGRVDLSPDFFIQDSNAHTHGFVISDMNATIFLAADTAELKGYWMHMVANVIRKLKERAIDDHHVVLPTHSPDDLKEIYEHKLEEFKRSKLNRPKSFFFRKKKEQEEELVKKAGEVAVKQTYEELKVLEQRRQKELEELHAKLQNMEGEAQKFKSEADLERERAEREAARAEEEKKRREEAEARAGMSVEEWQAEARARELELQRERDEIRALLEESNKKRHLTAQPGAGGATNEEIERLERERKALQAKLDALSKALDLDMGGLEWDGTLEDAEAKMKALVPKLCSEDEKEAREAQVMFDQWDKIIRNHADYKKREEEKWIKWEEDQKEANQKALQEMKKIVPPEILTGVDMQLLTKRGLSNPVAQRVMKTKIFLFLYMDKNTIAKTHIADLSTRYVIQGLDIVEMRAIYTCLPEEFQLDGDGKKALWKETYRAKLHQMTQKEKDGSLSKNDARNPAYKPQESTKGVAANGSIATHPTGTGGMKPNPMAGALAGLFAGRGGPSGGAPPTNPIAAMLAGRGNGAPNGAPANAPPVNPVAALFAGRGAGGGLPPQPPKVVQASAQAATPVKRPSATEAARPTSGSTAGVRTPAGSTAISRAPAGSASALKSAIALKFEQAQREKIEEAKKRASKKIDLGYTFNAPGSDADGATSNGTSSTSGGPLLSKDAQALLDKMRQQGNGGSFDGEVKTYDFLGAEEERNKKGGAWVDEGLTKVTEIIAKHGRKDMKEGGVATMKFGELYAKYGEGSDMLVGILMRAKKQKRVKYTGDMLFKDVHDNVNITLL